MTSYFDLNDKLFLVTGASSGIGNEVCRAIHQMNGRFIAVARREAELQQLLAETDAGRNQYIVADLRNPDAVTSLASQVKGLDGMVHAAGIVKLMPLKFYSAELLEDIRATNYDSVVWLMNKLVQQKHLSKGASVVLVSSIAASFGLKGNGIYAGMKGALEAISRVWAVELAPQRIRVNCVAPGMVRTTITLQTMEQVSAEAIAADEKKYPLGYGNPGDVANPIVFLLSEASRWITGQTLILDGGRTSSI